jgi:adenylate kinase
MILIFGAPGSGKSMQGQFLAARNNWRWLSAGQLLRDRKDPELTEKMRKGELVDTDKVNNIIADSLEKSSDIDKLILDGFPRSLDQAEFLVHLGGIKRTIKAVIVLDADKQVILSRLALRGRLDDNVVTVESRFLQYESVMEPIIDYFRSQGLDIIKIDGNGTVGEVHDRIMQQLTERKLV